MASRRRNGARARSRMEEAFLAGSRELSRYAVLADVEAAAGVPRELLVAWCGPVVAVWSGALGLGARGLVRLVCVAYPSVASARYVAARAQQQQGHHAAPRLERTQWLAYWTIFAGFELLESLAPHSLLSAFPFWWAFKLGLFVFLQAPSTKGASYANDFLLAPLTRSPSSGGGAAAHAHGGSADSPTAANAVANAHGLPRSHDSVTTLPAVTR